MQLRRPSRHRLPLGALPAARHGTAVLEFGLVGPVLIIVIMLLLETAWQLSVELALNIGVMVGSRYSATGAGYAEGTRDSAVIGALLSMSGGILSQSNLSYAAQAYATPAGYASGGASTSSNGSSGQLVLYKVIYKQAFLTPFPAMILGYGSINHSVTFVAKNEPF